MGLFALGTYPGAEDVVRERDYGHTTHAIIRNLKLKAGLTYYAKVEGE